MSKNQDFYFILLNGSVKCVFLTVFVSDSEDQVNLELVTKLFTSSLWCMRRGGARALFIVIFKTRPPRGLLPQRKDHLSILCVFAKAELNNFCLFLKQLILFEKCESALLRKATSNFSRWHVSEINNLKKVKYFLWFLLRLFYVFEGRRNILLRFSTT